MTTLVVRRDELFFVFHHSAATLRTSDNAVDRLVEGAVVDELRVRASGKQGCLVQNVGEVGTGETGGLASNDLEVDACCHRFVLGVHLKDLVAAFHVGSIHTDLAVETTRAKKCRVENVGTVGRGDHNDVDLGVEAVHLDEHLVECLLALVVTATHSGTTVTTDSVDLVNEDDGGGCLLCLLEQVANTAGTDTDEHFDEVRTRNGKERNACFTSNGASQQSLTGSGRAIEKNTLGDASAHGLESGRVFQEVFNFTELFDGLVSTSYVGERNGRSFFGDELVSRLTKLHDSAATATSGAHHEPEEQTDQKNREQEPEGRHQPVVVRDIIVVSARELGVVDGRDDLLTARGHPEELNLAAVLGIGCDEFHIDALVAAVDRGFFDLAISQHGEALVGRDGFVAVHRNQRRANPDGSNCQDHVNERAAEDFLEIHGVSRLPVSMSASAGCLPSAQFVEGD